MDSKINPWIYLESMDSGINPLDFCGIRGFHYILILGFHVRPIISTDFIKNPRILDKSHKSSDFVIHGFISQSMDLSRIHGFRNQSIGFLWNPRISLHFNPRISCATYISMDFIKKIQGFRKSHKSPDFVIRGFSNQSNGFMWIRGFHCLIPGFPVLYPRIS